MLVIATALRTWNLTPPVQLLYRPAGHSPHEKAPGLHPRCVTCAQADITGHYICWMKRDCQDATHFYYEHHLHLDLLIWACWTHVRCWAVPINWTLLFSGGSCPLRFAVVTTEIQPLVCWLDTWELHVGYVGLCMYLFKFCISVYVCMCAAYVGICMYYVTHVNLCTPMPLCA
jgi:hypothetical protein